MMIFQFPKYFLCFFFLIIAYQPQLTFTSYLKRCGTHLRYNDYSKLINPVCSPNYAKFISCLQSKLNKSTSAVDQQFYNSVDFANFEKKTDRFCNKYNRLDFEKNHCDTSSIKIPKSSALCVDDHVRLEYLKLKKCPVNVRMLWFAYRESTFRNGCLIIDPWYQIIPRYGPDIACYRDFVETSENLRRDNTSLVDVYEKFCKQFNAESLFRCINQTFDNLDPHVLSGGEKKKRQVCSANMFVLNRQDLCENFDRLKKKLVRPEVGTILECKKQMAESRVSSIEALATKYSKCLFSNSALSKLVYDNLMSTKDTEQCRTNSSYFEYQFGMRNRAESSYMSVLNILLTFSFTNVLLNLIQ